MYLKELLLNDFRNYSRLYIQPHPELNFITGPNATGKTNLLEAVFYSGLGRTIRGLERDLIRWGADRARLKAVYHLTGGTVEVETEITNDGKKKMLVDGADYGRQDLPGRFGIVLFRPDDLQIIKGPPAQRREFIDNDLGVMEPLYRDNLVKYRRVLAHRNYMLRSEGENNRETLRIWDEQLYLYGSLLLFDRLKLFKKFFPLVRKCYHEISGAGEELAIKYLSTIKLSGVDTPQQIARAFEAEGNARHKEELYKRQTIVGPHRDDLVFYLNGKDVKQYGSQGQIRSVVLALKTAQMKMFNLETGEQPVLLLDDVLMELDRSRQEYLLEMVGGRRQAFITSATGKENFNRYQGKIYLVDGLEIKEEK